MYIHLDVQSPNLPLHSYGRFQDVLESAVQRKFFPGQSWKVPNVLESADTKFKKSRKLPLDRHICICIYYIYQFNINFILN